MSDKDVMNCDSFPARNDGATTLTQFAALSEEMLCGLRISGGPHKSLH